MQFRPHVPKTGSDHYLLSSRKIKSETFLFSHFRQNINNNNINNNFFKIIYNNVGLYYAYSIQICSRAQTETTKPKLIVD